MAVAVRSWSSLPVVTAKWHKAFKARRLLTLMVEKNIKNQNIQLLLLQESVWQIEEKIERSLDEIAKNQGALLAIKTMTESMLRKLGVEPPKTKRRGYMK